MRHKYAPVNSESALYPPDPLSPDYHRGKGEEEGEVSNLSKSRPIAIIVV